MHIYTYILTICTHSATYTTGLSFITRFCSLRENSLLVLPEIQW
uniref:Uncharacterized protein n=1 Tax=Anguilla anguilla TaxID=7936 RepID=A0A0E9W437_ANGAN